MGLEARSVRPPMVGWPITPPSKPTYASIQLLLPSLSPPQTHVAHHPAGERRRQSPTMPTAAAARAFFSQPPGPPPVLRAAAVSFPRQSPPAVALSLSVSAPGPALSWAPPAANPKYHNAKVDAGDEEVSGDELLRRFTREVARAGVMHEVRRRRRHEDARDKRKRKSRDAAWRNRRRRFKGRYPFDEEQEPKEGATDDDRHDNWELPGGDLPSYR